MPPVARPATRAPYARRRAQRADARAVDEPRRTGVVRQPRHLQGGVRPVSSAVIAAAEPLAGRVVLDVGCGTGGLSRLVADRGGTPVGADISSTMIDGARQLLPRAALRGRRRAGWRPRRARAGWLRPRDLGVRGDVLRRPGRRVRQHRRGGAAAGDDGVRLLAVAGGERDVLPRHAPAGRADAGPATAGEPVPTGPDGVRRRRLPGEACSGRPAGSTSTSHRSTSISASGSTGATASRNASP